MIETQLEENDTEEETLDPLEEYFDKKNFIPKWLGDEILKEAKYITFSDDKETYFYDEKEGLYRKGDIFIKAIAQRKLGEEVRRNYLEETMNYIKHATVINRGDMEPPTRLIAVQNGILDIPNECILPFTSRYFFTTKIPIKFDPTAKCPKIEKFFTSILTPDDEQVVREIFAYCLWKELPIQKSIMFWGEGSNGKSTLINLLKKFLGDDNCVSIALQDLSTNRFAAARLYKKLANLYADVQSQALRDSGIFKMVTGGDTISGEHKYKDPFSFVNYAKLIFSANVIPLTKDDTDAFFRRWVIINFPYIFDESRQDPDLLKKITVPEEMSGLLNIAVRELNLLLIAGRFSNSKTTDQLRLDYISKSEPVGAFIMEHIESDGEGFEFKEDVFNSFISYCQKKKVPPISIETFSRRFIMKVKVKEERKGTDRKRGWKGIKLELEGVEEKESDATGEAEYKDKTVKKGSLEGFL